MTKKQLEVPGAERPSIPGLDRLAAECIELEAEIKAAKARLKAKREHGQYLLEQHGLKDSGYVFKDGEQSYSVQSGATSWFKIKPL